MPLPFRPLRLGSPSAAALFRPASLCPAALLWLASSTLATPCQAAPKIAREKTAEAGAAESAQARATREPSAKELSVARQKFQQALALQTGGNWARALGLLKEVAEIKATPQVRFNMALCEENLGQLVAALGDYELAAADAAAAGAAHVEAEAIDRLEKLRKNIPKLRILPAADAGQATFIVDGVALGESVLDREMPVDPGTHVVRLEAAGRAPLEQEVHVEPGEVATVRFTLPPREKEAPPPAPTPPAETGNGTPRALAYVSGGLGVAALATSGFFFWQRQNAISELDGKCPSRTDCPNDTREVAERGRTNTLIANVSLGVGAALTATAAVLFLTSDSGAPGPRETARREKARGAFSTLTLSPSHERAPLGATLSGRF